MSAAYDRGGTTGSVRVIVYFECTVWSAASNIVVPLNLKD